MSFREPVFAEDALARRWGVGIVAPSIVVLFIVSVTAVFTWPALRTFDFCLGLISGANINNAAGLALAFAVFGAGVLVAFRHDPRTLAVILLVVSALLGLCLLFVAADSAAYSFSTDTYQGECLSGDGEAHSVAYLYPVWGSAAVLLVVQAVRAFRQAWFAERERERELVADPGDGS